jgi:methylmalonyl-CoA/ethylmalonyl-CoA epimerase
MLPSLHGMDKVRPPEVEQLGDQILGMDHIAIAVDNLEEAIHWYSKESGFSLVERHETRGSSSGMLSAVMQTGTMTVVLLQGTEPESQITRFLASSRSAVHHIAYTVANLDEAVRQATELGCEADTPIFEDVGIRQVFMPRDPVTGIRVELVERQNGTFTEHNIEQLFKTMEEKGLY